MNRKHINILLSSNGDGTGTTNANGDYSSTPLSLKYSDGDASDTCLIHRLIVMIEDAGSFDSGKYGNNITVTNGIRVYVRDSEDNILEELTAFPITTNGEWGGHCHDITVHSFGSGNEVMSVRWTFSKSGQPVILNYTDGEYLEVYLNDDFSGLLKHYFLIQGSYLNEDYE